MAKNAHSITTLNIKVNHLEDEFFQLTKRVGMLEAERENHKKLPSTPAKIMQDESTASKNYSPLTRIGKDFNQIIWMGTTCWATWTQFFVLFYLI